MLRTEEVLEAHGLQLLLQAEIVLDAEAWDLHSHGGLGHCVQPVAEFLQGERRFHLHNSHR